jgi:hypothetical protein
MAQSQKLTPVANISTKRTPVACSSQGGSMASQLVSIANSVEALEKKQARKPGIDSADCWRVENVPISTNSLLRPTSPPKRRHWHYFRKEVLWNPNEEVFPTLCKHWTGNKQESPRLTRLIDGNLRVSSIKNSLASPISLAITIQT